MMVDLTTLHDEISSAIPKLLHTLTSWCNINTHAYNLRGLSKLRTLIHQQFSMLTQHIETIDYPPIRTWSRPEQPVGPALWIQQRPELKRRILLVGHMDTVFHEHHAFQAVQPISPSQWRGPGIVDMKSGLLVLWSALYFFEQFEISKTLGWDVFINADEEIGSLASGLDLMNRARNHQVGLVFEPALDEHGTLARERKGIGHYILSAQGLSAHAGRNFHQGRNAIIMLSEALLALHQLNQTPHEVIWNIASIEGGSQANQVPDFACAFIEVRFAHPSQQAWIEEQLNLCCLNQPGLSFEGHVHRPAKNISLKTQKLFELYQAIAMSLKVPVDWKNTGGACDGNLLAQQGLPVLDTLGARGGGLHTEQEYLILDSLAERIEITTRLLLALSEGKLEQLSC